MKRTTLISLVILLALIGLADAVYLATAAMTDTPLTCTIEGLSGCNVVAQSPYARLFGIPLGLYGVAFYALMLCVAVLARRIPALARPLFILAVIGALVSAWFLYVQLFLIQALCVYCLGSALVALGLCVPAFLLIRPSGSPPSAP